MLELGSFHTLASYGVRTYHAFKHLNLNLKINHYTKHKHNHQINGRLNISREPIFKKIIYR